MFPPRPVCLLQTVGEPSVLSAPFSAHLCTAACEAQAEACLQSDIQVVRRGTIIQECALLLINMECRLLSDHGEGRVFRPKSAGFGRIDQHINDRLV